MKFIDILNEAKEEWVLYNITDPKNMVRGLNKPYKTIRDAQRQIPRGDDDWVAVLKKNYLKLKDLKETITESVDELDAEEILRKNNFKIKAVHGTKFGTEYVMAKKYEEDEIKEVLKNFSLKFDGKSIFVIG